jgi:hypothetical protein
VGYSNQPLQPRACAMSSSPTRPLRASSPSILFLVPLLTALDEYSIPNQISTQIKGRILPPQHLHELLQKLKSMAPQPQSLHLSRFETLVCGGRSRRCNGRGGSPVTRALGVRCRSGVPVIGNNRCPIDRGVGVLAELTGLEG